MAQVSQWRYRMDPADLSHSLYSLSLSFPLVLHLSIALPPTISQRKHPSERVRDTNPQQTKTNNVKTPKIHGLWCSRTLGVDRQRLDIFDPVVANG